MLAYVVRAVTPGTYAHPAATVEDMYRPQYSARTATGMAIAPAQAGWRFRQPSVIPGFGLTLGFSLAYLTLIILIPLSGLVWRSAALGWTDFWAIVADRRTINALEISFGTAFLAAAVNVVFGTIVAWVLVRYRFPGRRIVDAMARAISPRPISISSTRPKARTFSPATATASATRRSRQSTRTSSRRSAC